MKAGYLTNIKDWKKHVLTHIHAPRKTYNISRDNKIREIFQDDSHYFNFYGNNIVKKYKKPQIFSSK